MIDELPTFQSVTGWPQTFWLTQQVRVDRDYAVFGDLTFDVTEKLKLIGGIRFFWVNNTLNGFFGFNDNGYSSNGEAICTSELFTQPGVYTGGNMPCVNTTKKVVENGETHKLNLTYQLTPDIMVYGTWSTSRSSAPTASR